MADQDDDQFDAWLGEELERTLHSIAPLRPRAEQAAYRRSRRQRAQRRPGNPHLLVAPALLAVALAAVAGLVTVSAAAGRVNPVSWRAAASQVLHDLGRARGATTPPAAAPPQSPPVGVPPASAASRARTASPLPIRGTDPASSPRGHVAPVQAGNQTRGTGLPASAARQP